MQKEPSKQGHERKENPSREQGKEPQTNEKNFGQNKERTEVNSGNLGNNREVNLDRNGSQQSSQKQQSGRQDVDTNGGKNLGKGGYDSRTPTGDGKDKGEEEIIFNPDTEKGAHGKNDQITPKPAADRSGNPASI